MPSEAVSYPHYHRHSRSSLGTTPKQPSESSYSTSEPYETKHYRPYESSSLSDHDTRQQHGWNQPLKMEESQGFLHYTPPYTSESQAFGRSNLILPPPSSLIPTLVDPYGQNQGYNMFTHQRDERANKVDRVARRKSKRQLPPPPPPPVSTPGYHYEVLNMAKPKRSKRDATAAETLASFSRLSPTTGPNYSGAEGSRCAGGDEYNNSRGRNTGESSYHDSQTLVIE
ncbi:hypothetical protein Unana1_01866, partial [Umbelopsis nana]